MIRNRHTLEQLMVSFFLIFCLAAGLSGAEPKALFDGETLKGWEGDPDWWEVRDGKIVGGSNERDIPHNLFLMTEASYQNFELIMHLRLHGDGNRPNSGIQVRSARIPDSPEVEGYQVDAGDGYWGKLYDEKRRRWLVGTGGNPYRKGKQAANSTGWNTYRIRCEGPTISAWINGEKIFEYTEEDEDIPLNGKIGIQVHSGGPSRVEVRKAVITPLSPTEGAPAWPEDRLGLQVTDQLHRRKQAQPLTEEQINSAVGLGNQVGIEQEPMTPDDQKEAFILPENFEIELVAAETDEVGKFINVKWDTAGRLWTMTGREYPVSTGHSDPGSEVYELFEKGGRDRVVVYPDPYGTGPHRYQTFLDGMVQPLGILPYHSGAYVQHGQEIRYYRDRNGDGKADDYETVLEGFGIQDSHLFPHRFKQSPGGWIYMGQGLFNRSTVRRPGNKPFRDGRKKVTYHGTKLARFRPDGSDFEIQTWGPNNIWGHVKSRRGEEFIQEANDLGMPVIPYEPATHYETGYDKKAKPYAPQIPQSFSGRKMGGTGLSGLALVDDRGADGWPVPWGQSTKETKRFLVANPLNNRIQRIKAEWNGSHYEYTKQSPLLVTKDAWFRPVAIHFGPDGALYVVDWYNKIISHNEISIDHKARDKRRGRIWRIYHENQPRDGVPDLTEVPNQKLLNSLGHNHTRLSKLAWQEVHRRGDQSLVSDLRKIIQSDDTSDGRTFAALWALEGLTNPGDDLLVSLLNADNGNLRTEAVRIIDEHGLLSNRLVEKLHKHVNDPYHRVRAAIGNLLRRRTDEMNPSLIRMALRLGGSAATSGNRWERYYGNFERYLARWALEGNHSDLKQLITGSDSSSLSPSSQVYAGLLLDSAEGAKLIARAASDLDRSLTDEEFSLLAEHFQQPAVRKTALSLLQSDAQRDRVLDMLTSMNAEHITPELRSSVQDEVQKILASNPDADDWKRVTELAGTFRLKKLAPKIKQRLRSNKLDAESKTAGIKALKRIAPEEIQMFVDLSKSSNPSVRREALLALTASDSAEAVDHVLDRIQAVSMSLRTLVLNRLASSTSHAPKLVRAALNNRISGIDGDLLNRLESVLGKDHEGLARLREQVKQRTRQVLHVGKNGDGYAKADITLDGGFTVEAWVKLIPPITNRHHLVGATDGASDFNFHASKFRVHNGEKDVIIAESKIKPRTWTHVAITRDDSGQFTIYMNGKRDAEGSGQADRTFKHLQVGTGRVDGAEAYYMEFRVWSEQRTGEQIRKHLLNTFRDKSSRPSTLTHYFYGDKWPKLKGNAEIVRESNVPDLKVQKNESEKFQKYLSLARKTGNADRGRKIFENRCSTCHTTGGEDKTIGPSLKGVAHSGTTAVLNSVLYPDASIQAGYRQFRLKTTDGDLVTGVKTGESEDGVTVRLISGETERIPRNRIQSAGYVDSSVMPDGLLNGLSDQQVRDLFSYLETLK